MERLEERGIIGGYTVRLTEDYARARIRAHVLITVAPKLAPRVEDQKQGLLPLNQTALEIQPVMQARKQA